MLHNVQTLGGQDLPTLQLEPSRSVVRRGDSVLVDCASSEGASVPVEWTRSGEQRLPYNVRTI